VILKALRLFFFIKKKRGKKRIIKRKCAYKNLRFLFCSARVRAFDFLLARAGKKEL
jgi:hypothetical protein